MSNKFKESLKKRAQNKIFWISLVSAVIVAIQYIGQLFGIEIDLAGKEDILMKLINSVFTILIILGVVIEPTTPGIRDGIPEDKNNATECINTTASVSIPEAEVPTEENTESAETE